MFNSKNKPPPLNGDHNRAPEIKAIKRRGFINHGSKLTSNPNPSFNSGLVTVFLVRDILPTEVGDYTTLNPKSLLPKKELHRRVLVEPLADMLTFRGFIGLG